MDNKKIWLENLKKIKDYLDENKKRPPQQDKNNNIKILGHWISEQLMSYKKEKNIMKNPEIRKQWEEFINDDKYKKYFS